MATRCLTRSISALFGCALILAAASGCALLNPIDFRPTEDAR
jgi:hypothetical protein